MKWAFDPRNNEGNKNRSCWGIIKGVAEPGERYSRFGTVESRFGTKLVATPGKGTGTRGN